MHPEGCKCATCANYARGWAEEQLIESRAANNRLMEALVEIRDKACAEPCSRNCCSNTIWHVASAAIHNGGKMIESTCMACGMPTEKVRPGKHQCLYCEALGDNEQLRAENERLKRELSEAKTAFGVWKTARQKALAENERLRGVLENAALNFEGLASGHLGRNDGMTAARVCRAEARDSAGVAESGEG